MFPQVEIPRDSSVFSPEGFLRLNESHETFWMISLPVGLPYGKLLDRLIELALERHEAESRLKRTYGD